MARLSTDGINNQMSSTFTARDFTQKTQSAPIWPLSASDYKVRSAKKLWLAVVMLILLIACNVLRSFISATSLAYARRVLIVVCIWATACAVIFTICSYWAVRCEHANTRARRNEACTKLMVCGMIADILSLRFESVNYGKYMRYFASCGFVMIVAMFAPTNAIIAAIIFEITWNICLLLVSYFAALALISVILADKERELNEFPVGQALNEVEAISERIEDLHDLLSILPFH